MVEVKSIPYINADDIKELIGVDWTFCELSQMAENDSYQIINCTDWYLEELYEEYDDTKKELDCINMDDTWAVKNCYPARVLNDIKLIEALRQMGYRDTVLCWISW